MKLLFLMLIIHTNFIIGQTYLASYEGIYKNKNNILNISSKNDIYIGDLLKKASGTDVIFTYTMTIISNNTYGLLKVGIANNNLLPVADDTTADIYFIDYASNTVYDFQKKTRSECIMNKTENATPIKKGEPVFNEYIIYNRDTAIVTFDTSLPKEISSKSFLKNNSFGIRKIITRRDEVVLKKYQPITFDFSPYVEYLKKLDTIKGKPLNYLFGK